MTNANTNNWVKIPFGELFFVKRGSGLSKSDLSSYGKTPCILYGELYTRYSEVIESVVNFTDSTKGLVSQEGDLLIPASTTTNGNDLANVTSLNQAGVLLGGDINVLRPKPNVPEYISDYMAYYLTHIKKKDIATAAQGITIIHLYGKDLSDIPLSFPDIKQQRKALFIIESTNESIEATQKIIYKTERLKKALMQKLLTCGIGHTKFKQTEIGEIPESWRPVPLDSVTKRGTGHTPNKKMPEYYKGEIKWVSLADSKKLDNGLISETAIKIAQEGINHSSAVVHPKGSVLLSRDAGIGKSAVMAENMAVSQHFIVWTCGDQINNWYLYYFLQLRKPVFENIASGSTIKTIGLPFFKAMLIGLPPVKEQERIARTLRAIDEKIDCNKKLKAKQEDLKYGLMQDLLMGKVKI